MRPDRTTGPLVASVAAGPIITSALVVIGLLGRGSGFDEVGASVMILFFSALFGFAIALIPNFVGASALTWAGSRDARFRHPSIWAISGFVLGWVIPATLWQTMSAANAFIAVDGVICALICRYFATWED